MLILSSLLLSLPLPAAQQLGDEHYETHIRPLLAERCGECHGAGHPEAALRLTTPGGLRAGSDAGAVFVPGDPDASRLIQAVRYGDPELQMPPKGKLPDDELALLEEWVRAGAPLPEGEAEAPPVEEFDLEARLAHWSFQPIGDPAPPAVTGADWPRADLDRFVRARLESEGLTPAPEADRRVWLRRVHYALNGLPPTPDDVAAFLADEGEDAYERVVDALLASPRFGETWARHWLDLVRYCETKGHEFDYPIPNPWHYRDYIIRALNRDVPYDQLLLEHLAGDLLETPRTHPEEGFDESVLGTGFWWFGDEVHSPTDPRKDETDRVANQIDVFSKTFLGLTVACARCHDHKFDPISQKDYYALSGYLQSSSYRQVRFDSAATNRAVAAELAEVRRAQTDRWGSSAVAVVEAELDAAGPILAVLGEVLSEPLPEVPVPATGDVLIEDFEDESWEPWEAQGDAFGDGPVDVNRAHKSLAELRAVGARVANSYSTHRTDKRIGRLLSPEFKVSRRYLHFRVGGGSMDGVRVELWHANAPVHTARGEQKDEMRSAVFDLEDLRGESVQLRVIDDTKEGWGQIGVDHFVLSDQDDPEALEDSPFDAEQAAEQARIEVVAKRHGVDPQRLLAWSDWAGEALVHEGGGRSRLQPRQVFTESYDPAQAPELPMIDSPLVERLDAGPPVLRVTPQGPRFEGGGTWVEDLAWENLSTAPGHMGEPGRRVWDQAGRSLVLPTRTLEEGVLMYLVRGTVDIFVEVDSHRLVQGPLHQSTIQRVDTGGRWKLVKHDLARYSGSRARIEMTPRADGESFALAGVREGALRGKLPTSGPNPIDRLNAGPPDWTERQRDAVLAGLRRDLEAWQRGELLLEWPTSLLRLGIEVGGAPPELVEGLDAWAQTEVEALNGARFDSRIALALRDTPGCDEFLLARGQVNAAGDPVPRRNLEAFGGAAPQGPGSGRLELAAELVNPDNPLVTRVAANRIWHHLFGRGIVASVDDFGVMGAAPSHPELLDFLARRLVALGWSQKALIREIVLSATYRQSSEVDPAAMGRDPENLLLGRAPVRRTTAEALRDGMLFASGELNEGHDGPSVPVHLTTFLEGRGRPGNSGPLDGDGRRSVYLEVRRNFLQPFLMVFDFPVPATTIGRRANSNVPAQALALLNDPFVHELCKRMGERLVEVEDPGARLDEVFLRALGRGARDAEAESLLAFAREEGIDAPETWANLVHLVFNMKEFRFLE